MMLGWDIHLIALLIMAVWFIWQAFQHKQFQWLWFSVALWLVLGLFSARVMPHVLGITHTANAFLLPTYLFIGSIFFWLNTVERLPENPKYFQSRIHAPALTLFAISSLAIHLAFLVLVIAIGLLYPTGVSAYVAAFIVRLFLDPINWLCLQVFLMALFAFHRRICHERVDTFSVVQIEMGFLMSFLWLAAANYGLLVQLFRR